MFGNSSQELNKSRNRNFLVLSSFFSLSFFFFFCFWPNIFSSIVCGKKFFFLKFALVSFRFLFLNFFYNFQAFLKPLKQIYKGSFLMKNFKFNRFYMNISILIQMFWNLNRLWGHKIQIKTFVTILVVLLCPFTVFQYRHDSLQVKWDLIPLIINFVCELSHMLPNNVRYRS